MKKHSLDFIVIGAAKSGTTSLFELLRQHPNIFLPKEKELPFFSDNTLYSKGIDNFLSKAYSNVEQQLITGKITPQYMEGSDGVPPNDIAKRMHTTLPDVKIIAILRDPVERAYSLYKMASRQQYEKNEFDERISYLLKRENLRDSRNNIKPDNTYITGGEYGRILSYYYKYFPPSQLLVLFFDELKSNPETISKKIQNFLNLQHADLELLESKMYKGGLEPKLKILTPGYIYRIPLVKLLWNNCVPFRFKRFVNSKINIWNTKTTGSRVGPSKNTVQKLENYYKTDTMKLENLLNIDLPWSNR